MKENSTKIELPELDENWECELFGTGRQIILTPLKGKVPNLFWRKMQYIFFGNKWNKVIK